MGDEEDAWWTGPAGDRRRYRLASPTPLPGGQAFVFEARRVGDQPVAVALKLIDDDRPDLEAGIRARWALVAEHPHPRVAQLVEIFRGPGLFNDATPPPDEDSDLLYVATAWVPGRSLRSLAPLAHDAVAVIARDLAEALTHLHDSCGLIHRDVHPGNVIVDDDGRATLIDLGSAHRDDGSVPATVSGVLGFIPPERSERHDDRRTDAWGLGMVVAHALLGHPIGREPAGQLEQELRRTLPQGSDPAEVRTLIEAMTSRDPDSRPPDLIGWAEALSTAMGPHRSRRRVARALIAAGAVGLVALAMLAAARLGAEDGPARALATDEAPTAPRVSTACDEALGAPDPALSAEDAATVRAATSALEAAADDACAIGRAALFGDAVHQAISDHGSTEVVLSSPVAAVRLTAAEWASYREIAGRQRPENAITFGGYPTEVVSSNVAGTQIELSQGGLLLGRRRDTQSFWLPGPVRALWEGRGGLDGDLGFPMTNPFVIPSGLRQDFEGGHIVVSAEVMVPLASISSDMLEVHIEEDPAAPLRDLDLAGRIVRQPTGTAWWVDQDGRRHWIPDGDTYLCAGGDAGVVANDVPGATVATLELGPAATCKGMR